MDAFSEMLAAMKLKGALFFRGEFSAPWFIGSPPSRELAPALSPGATHLVIYHLLTEGDALVRFGDAQPLPLTAGDVVVFPHGDPHQMMSVDAGCSVEDSAVSMKVRAHDLTPLRVGGGGARTRFVCGYMACDPVFCQPILEGLPAVMKIGIRTDASGSWLENAILHLLDEAGSGEPGSEAMLAKLSEALFVDTLRRYVGTLPAEQTGWLAGARDPVVGKALAILHRRFREPWTIAALAAEAGLSRSALVERFSRFLSIAPMGYLTRWRLQLAARELATTSRGTAAIAADVGYESEAAFNRAFKRELGLPPARYRKAARHDRTAVTRP